MKSYRWRKFYIVYIVGTKDIVYMFFCVLGVWILIINFFLSSRLRKKIFFFC